MAKKAAKPKPTLKTKQVPAQASLQKKPNRPHAPGNPIVNGTEPETVAFLPGQTEFNVWGNNLANPTRPDGSTLVFIDTTGVEHVIPEESVLLGGANTSNTSFGIIVRNWPLRARKKLGSGRLRITIVAGTSPRRRQASATVNATIQ